MATNKFINKITGDKAELTLHGEVGYEIDGIRLAAEIDSLIEANIKEITLRINSGGGSVVNGYSIVSSLYVAKSNGIIVKTINEGLCGSMAGIIFLCGSTGHRKMLDFSLLMLHEPTIFGESLDETKDEKIKHALIAFRDSLVKIVTNATGKTKEEIEQIFKAETWFNAKDAVNQGFADSIEKTNAKLSINKNMTTEEIISRVAAFHNVKNKNMEDLKAINSHLGLSEDAVGSSTLSEIKKIQDSVAVATKNLKEKTEAITALEAEKATLTAKVTELEKEAAVVAEAKKTETKHQVELAIETAIGSGKIDETKKESLVETFAENLTGLTELLASLKEVHPVSINNQIKNAAPATSESRRNWTMDDYIDKGFEGELKKTNPKLHQELMDKWEVKTTVN